VWVCCRCISCCSVKRKIWHQCLKFPVSGHRSSFRILREHALSGSGLNCFNGLGPVGFLSRTEIDQLSYACAHS
jgi:hypothetical protein